MVILSCDEDEVKHDEQENLTQDVASCVFTSAKIQTLDFLASVQRCVVGSISLFPEKSTLRLLQSCQSSI